MSWQKLLDNGVLVFILIGGSTGILYGMRTIWRDLVIPIRDRFFDRITAFFDRLDAAVDQAKEWERKFGSAALRLANIQEKVQEVREVCDRMESHLTGDRPHRRKQRPERNDPPSPATGGQAGGN